ncbi:MAG: hypothetical protein JXR48_06085 [Candidatus Delongbacteria bacterium]|nr:hypothetical protein [Candidatus Delongbacteria bacterium]MBN2834520.1 hypothetical protein [Candidatus Delongbacteria bacterium]
MRIRKVLFIALISAYVVSCNNPTLISKADYNWPLEKVIQVTNDGLQVKTPDIFAFEVTVFFEKEGIVLGEDGALIRMIMGDKGYYYLTAKGFKTVYVLQWVEGGLAIKKEIKVSDEGLINPFFNQKKTNVLLVDGDNSYSINFTGIIGE